MKINKVLNVGDKVSICDKDKHKNEICYSSKVVDFNDEFITAEAPIAEGILVPLEVGKVFNIQFNATKGGYFYVRAELVKRTKERIPLVELKISSEIFRIQRRQFFRFDCWIKAKLKLFNIEDLERLTDLRYKSANNMNGNEESIGDSANNNENAEIEFFTSHIKDISGGGMCLQTDEELKPGNLLLSIFEIEDQEIKSVLEVIRSTKIDKAYKYQIATKYYKIDENSKDKIMKYIVTQQRILIRRNGSV